MKFRLILALVFVPLLASAQKQELIDGKLGGVLPVNEAGKVTYQSVKSMPGVSRDELFKRARKWFVKTYNSANSVLQTNDSQTGELAGKGIFDIGAAMMGVTHVYPVRHLISVEVKDEKYRTTLSDLTLDHVNLKGPVETARLPMAGKKYHAKIYEGVNSASLSLLQSLDKAMQTSDDF